MDKLQRYDMVVGVSSVQYSEIAKISGVDEPFFVESSLARGGCFWSDRYGIPIPGRLDRGNQIPVELFIKRLKKSKS